MQYRLDLLRVLALNLNVEKIKKQTKKLKTYINVIYGLDFL